MSNMAAPEELPGPPEAVGRYRILAPLGRGAMGVVYRARDTVLDREVAVKIMVAGLGPDSGIRARFEREAQIVARINHPNVIVVYDLGYHTDGAPFIAMELLSGQDLAVVLQARPLDEDDSAAVALQVLAGLARAHKKGIVHRDVKPANVFITRDGKVKVMDFGVARLTAAAVTATGAVLGTAYYMSPEQIRGGHVDGRSDVFSVGCVLYEMLASRRPFEAGDMLGILYQIAHTEPDFSNVPPAGQALVPFLQRALEKDADQRYPSALDFARDLQAHLKENARSPWARHAAEVVELAPSEGSGPVPGTQVAPAETIVGTAGAGPLAHLVEDPPTAEPFPVSEPATFEAPVTVDAEPTVVTLPPVAKPPPAKSPAPRPATPAPRAARPGSGVLVAVVGALVVVSAAAIWLWRSRSPEASTSPPPAAATAAPAPTPPAARPGEAPQATLEEGRSATVAPAPLETREPARPAAPEEAALAGRERLSAPEPTGVEVPPEPSARVEPPPPEPAPPATGAAETPAAPAAAPPVAAPRSAEVPVVPPEPAPPQTAPPTSAAPTGAPAPSAPATSAPATSAPATSAPATTAPVPSPPATAAAPPPTAAPATAPPAPRSPLVVGATRGQRFDGRALPRNVQIDFRVEPDTPAPGGRSRVDARLLNDGAASIQVRQIVVTVLSGGDRQRQTLPGRAEVAPGDEARLLRRTVSWPSGPPWSMEVVVHTRAGETYTNTVSWR